MWRFLARTVIATVVGSAALIALALPSYTLAWSAGLLGGASLGWAVAFSRVRRGPLALPPLLSVLGVVLFALACVAVVRPAAFYVPSWLVFVPATNVDGAGTDRVLGRERVAAPVVAAHARYRAAFADLLGVDERALCAVDVVMPDEAGYRVLAEAAAVDGAEMGFAHVPALGRRVVVHRPGSGWGSLTHHLAMHWVPCALPDAPPWLVQGVAALVEKHRLADGRFALWYRSDWRTPESQLRSAPRDLQRELVTADDQGFLRSFLLFIHHRGWLRAVLARVRDGDDAVAALADVTHMGPQALEAAWRAWLHDEAAHIPTLEAAAPDSSTPPI